MDVRRLFSRYTHVRTPHKIKTTRKGEKKIQKQMNGVRKTI